MVDPSLKSRYNLIAQLLKACGELIMTARIQMPESAILCKGDEADLVTCADQACDELLVNQIRQYYPDEPILTEESGLLGAIGVSSTGLNWHQVCELESVWIADPIDGTTNYVHQLEHYGVCLAWMQRGEIQVSGIYVPKTDQLYMASKGLGALCNGMAISVSTNQKLEKALLGTGLCLSQRGKRQHHLAEINSLADTTRGIRHLGSASCSLAKVACGQFDGFWIRDVKPWDVASGILLVEEAGGVVLPISQGSCPLQTGSLIAASPDIAKKLKEYIH